MHSRKLTDIDKKCNQVHVTLELKKENHQKFYIESTLFKSLQNNFIFI